MMLKKRITSFFIIVILVFVLCSACTRKKLHVSEAAAVDIIKSLPEVKRYGNHLDETHKDVKLIIRTESSFDNKNDKIELYVGEDHKTHTVLWNRFAVNKDTGKVFIYDINSGEYIPIEAWRK